MKLSQLMKKENAKADADIFLIFLFYCVCGWIYEVALGFIQGRGFINRGYLFGPWLPIYGFGAIMMLPFLKMKSKGPLAMFAATTLFATVIELIASYVMEYFNGAWLWDYSDLPLNFQGRIAVWPSLRFGILIMAMLDAVHPLLTGLLERIPWRVKRVVVSVLAVLFFADCIARLFYGSNLKDAALF